MVSRKESSERAASCRASLLPGPRGGLPRLPARPAGAVRASESGPPPLVLPSFCDELRASLTTHILSSCAGFSAWCGTWSLAYTRSVQWFVGVRDLGGSGRPKGRAKALSSCFVVLWRLMRGGDFTVPRAFESWGGCCTLCGRQPFPGLLSSGCWDVGIG